MISVIAPKCPSLTLKRTILCLSAKQETFYPLLEHNKNHLHQPIPLFSNIHQRSCFPFIFAAIK